MRLTRVSKAIQLFEIIIYNSAGRERKQKSNKNDFQIVIQIRNGG